jgi:hypothetical protein
VTICVLLRGPSGDVQGWRVGGAGDDLGHGQAEAEAVLDPAVDLGILLGEFRL